MKYEPNTEDPTIDDARARMMAQFGTSRDKSGSVVAVIFFLAGLGLLTGGFFSGRSQYNILKNWPKVDATVAKSEITTGHDNDNTAMYGAEFEFRYTVRGKEYQTPASSGYKTSSYKEMKHTVDIFAPGTQHALLYDPADPSEIRWDAGYNFSFFLVPICLGGMGIIFAGVGVLVWICFR